MKNLHIFLPVIFIGTIFSFIPFMGSSQNVAINATGNSADPSAGLDVNFNNKGFLPPRMTTAEMNAISSPAAGLQIFNTSTNCLMFYVNGSWQIISCACATAPTTPGTITGNANPCYGSTGVVYSIAALVGAGSYTWTVPAGDTITAGQGTPVIAVNIPGINYIRKNSVSGDITVTATNTCGTSAAQSIGGTNIDTSGASAFGPLAGIITENITFIPSNFGASSYSWAFQSGSPSTSTAQSPSVTWNTPGTYTISLTVTSGSGCSSTSVQSITISTLLNGQVFSYTGSMQTYTVPSGVTSLTIEALGAQGGNSSNYAGGLGAEMEASFTVTSGEVLKILVGQQPPSQGNAGGGGGGTFVATNSNTPLIVAGGGSGADASWGGTGYQNGAPGLTSTSGGNGCSSTGGSGGNGGGAGGSGSSGGGGFSSNGGVTSCTYGSSANGYGRSFLNGGAGGAAWSNCGTTNGGGYGGGSSSDPCCDGASGAGGGYSGGGGSTDCSNGIAGGGGSFIASGAVTISTTSGLWQGNGEVIIAH